MNILNKKKRKRAGVYLVGLLLFLLTILVYSAYFLDFATRTQTIEFSSTSDPILNPLMGWAPWASLKTVTQPHTLVYADLTWRDFEPREGVYDFAGFEQREQFVRWRHEGQRVVF